VLEIKSNNIEYLRGLIILDTHKDIDAQFAKIAAGIFSRTLLKIKSRPYKIMEIEFYYYSKGHPDIFTHSDEIQLKRGCWYFHKKEGSFKGLDITFGDGASYGGILLRAIESLDNSVYIEGPSKLVDEILRLHGHKKVRDLLNDELDLCVEIKNNPNAIKGIYKGKRIGLKPRKDDSDDTFINKSYRFCADVSKVKKNRNGLRK
jgi:3-methyladenine DNA glycosylase Mpg